MNLNDGLSNRNLEGQLSNFSRADQLDPKLLLVLQEIDNLSPQRRQKVLWLLRIDENPNR